MFFLLEHSFQRRAVLSPLYLLEKSRNTFILDFIEFSIANLSFKCDLCVTKLLAVLFSIV